MDITLQAEKRDINVKPKQLRKTGLVPACIYGKEMHPINIQIPKNKLKAVLDKHVKKLEVAIKDGENYLVGLDEVQRDALTSSYTHVSFHALNKNEKATLTVPVELTGKSIGQKSGGIITHIVHEVTIKGYPQDLPDCITIDISNLNIGELLHFSDIKDQYKFEFSADTLDLTVVKCAHAKVVVLDEVKTDNTASTGEVETTIEETPTPEKTAA